MSTYSQTIQAGGSWEIGVPGELFRVIVAAKPVNLTFKQNGVPIAQENNVLDGFWAKPAGGFNSVLIESAEAQTVTVGVFTGAAGYDRYSGVVTVANQITEKSGSMNVYEFSTGSVSLQAIDSNQQRKYLLLQNKGAVDVYVNFGGISSTSCVMLSPGGVWELNTFAPTNSLNLISPAGVGKVTVCEG